MDNQPTEITRADIDKVLNEWMAEIEEPIKMTKCTSCGVEMHYILTDYYTGQCQPCFYHRKPWCSSSPVREAFYKVEDGE